MKENNYFEKYLDSRLANIETVVTNLGDKVEMVSHNLEKTVDRALTEVAAIKKEAADNNRALTTWYVRGVWGAIALFVAIVALILGGYQHTSSLNNATRQEIRNDIKQLQHTLESQITKIGQTRP